MADVFVEPPLGLVLDETFALAAETDFSTLDCSPIALFVRAIGRDFIDQNKAPTFA